MRPRSPHAPGAPAVDEGGAVAAAASIVQPLLDARLAARQVDAPARPGSGRLRRRDLAMASERALAQVWAASSPPPQGAALAAVGSIARREPGPESDLDLVLLYDPRVLGATPTSLADRIWYPLWDAGLRLDHSVRTLPECRQVGAENLGAAVGLLDLRLLAGDESVVAAVRSSLAHDWRAHARTRLAELLDDVQVRHARHGDLAHLLAPDLKEARGGLRDMTIIRALTASWLADRPRGDLDTAYEVLLDVRDAVHAVTGRSRTRLAQQDQADVAAAAGYTDARAMQRAVSEAGRTISLALESTSRRAGQSQRARTPRAGARRPLMTPLGDGVYAHDGEVVLGSRADVTDPALGLRAARAAVRADLVLAPRTLETLATRVPAPPRPWPPTLLRLLGEVLAAGEALVGPWEALTLAGVVETWLPWWSDIRSLAQHNPVHRHTVDRHCLQTAVECRPFLTDVRRPDLLLVAALLHDVGKATGTTDHAATGAPVARVAALDLGLPAADADVVQRLVAQHLTLVEAATRRDPDASSTIEHVCAAVGHDPDVLELLRALTEADARAAGPAAWTSWRAGLVDGVVTQAREALAGAPRPEAAAGTERDEEDVALATVDPSTTGEDANALAVIVEAAEAASGQTVVEVSVPDRLGALADIAEVFAAQGVQVRSAELRATDGVARTRWTVEGLHGRPIDADRLQRVLRRRCAGPRGGGERPRAIGVAEVGGPPTRVDVDVDTAGGVLIEVRALDRPGLLRDLTRSFTDLGFSVERAWLDTFASVAVDRFRVSDVAGGRGASAPDRYVAVAEHIRVAVDDPQSAQTAGGFGRPIR